MGEDAVDVVRSALFEALIIALPILGAGLLIGLFVSLFQAVTQIQEQTLTFVPKIVVMIVVAIFLLSWISVRMMDFAHEMFTGMVTWKLTEYEAILSHVPPALLVVFRVGGLMIFGPVFGASVIPVRVKVMLAFLIGLAAYPLLAVEHGVGAGLRLELWALAPVIGVELLIGLIIGFLATLPMVAVQTGGLVMGQQMGLGFARFYNPAIDDEADVLGQILFFLALAGFLVIGGHEALVLAVLHSFEYIPLGSFAVDGDLLDLILGLLLAAFELALRVAAPLLALIFLQSLAMGYMAKTIPQLNILSLGFPIRILVGIGIVMLGLVVINEVVMDGIDVGLASIFEWIESQ